MDLDELQAFGFIELVQSAIDPQASCLHDARPEAYSKEAYSKEGYNEEGESDARASRAHAREENLDFELFKEVYPKRSGAQPWAKAIKAANARIKEGSSFDAMIYGALRYCDLL